jgi:sugar phosphate isomerase/epimerase
MKISFSTLGCPEWTWDDMIVTAKDLGFDGIEIRGIERELYAPKAKPFKDSNIKSTKERLSRLKLEIPCLTSSCFLFDRLNIDSNIREGKDYIDLANKLGTPYVRVLGDRTPEPLEQVDTDYVAANLSALAEYAEDKNVKVLIETNGTFANSEKLMGLLLKVNKNNVGVLWDIHHPFRFFNESPRQTYNILKDYIMFVHIKDSRIENGKVRYKMIGRGDVPADEALFILKDNNFSGFLSLEWVKRWNVDIEAPGIVFPHFINWVKSKFKQYK